MRQIVPFARNRAAGFNEDMLYGIAFGHQQVAHDLRLDGVHGPYPQRQSARAAEIGAQVQPVVRVGDERPMPVDEFLQTKVAEFVTTGGPGHHIAGELPGTLQLSGGMQGGEPCHHAARPLGGGFPPAGAWCNYRDGWYGRATCRVCLNIEGVDGLAPVTAHELHRCVPCSLFCEKGVMHTRDLQHRRAKRCGVILRVDRCQRVAGHACGHHQCGMLGSTPQMFQWLALDRRGMGGKGCEADVALAITRTERAGDARTGRRIEHRQTVDAYPGTFEIRLFNERALYRHRQARHGHTALRGFRCKPRAAGQIAGRADTMHPAGVERCDQPRGPGCGEATEGYRIHALRSTNSTMLPSGSLTIAMVVPGLMTVLGRVKAICSASNRWMTSSRLVTTKVR